MIRQRLAKKAKKRKDNKALKSKGERRRIINPIVNNNAGFDRSAFKPNAIYTPDTKGVLNKPVFDKSAWMPTDADTR